MGLKISAIIVVPSVIIFTSSAAAPTMAPIKAPGPAPIPPNHTPMAAPAAAPQAAPPATPSDLSATPPFSKPIVLLIKLPVPAPPVRAPRIPPSSFVRPAVSASITPLTAPRAKINGPKALLITLPIIGPAPASAVLAAGADVSAALPPASAAVPAVLAPASAAVPAVLAPASAAVPAVLAPDSAAVPAVLALDSAAVSPPLPKKLSMFGRYCSNPTANPARVAILVVQNTTCTKRSLEKNASSTILLKSF